MTKQSEQTSNWDIKKLLDWTADFFGRSGVDQGRLASEMLLGHVLKCNRIDLYTRFDYCPNPGELAEFRELIKRCGAHEPVGYLIGKAWFYSMELEVGPDVLIPRPETEVLVTEAIDFLRQSGNGQPANILDLCCGSGCIAIALTKTITNGKCMASDRSNAVLEIARKNITRYQLQERIHLTESDLFANIDTALAGKFDLIVSNPPYISDLEYEKLAANVKDYEPREALYGGPDGLDYYRKIINQAGEYLTDSGCLMVEVGYDQGRDVMELFKNSGFSNIAGIKDNLGHTRVIKGFCNES